MKKSMHWSTKETLNHERMEKLKGLCQFAQSYRLNKGSDCTMFAKSQVPNLFPIYDFPVSQLTVLGQSQYLAFGGGVVQSGYQRPSGMQDLLAHHISDVTDIPYDARTIFAS